MDKTIRRNDICVIGLPRCDFVFSSTRTCFIAYGFQESPLEMNLLKKLLEERGIQPVEAGGAFAPAQNAYCAKICSKIITSQFCVVLLNNDEADGREIPNANVNMEYGLMLGFNKYVLPFQRSAQRLPFNVAGLDTIKYTNTDFDRLAAEAIDQAIRETQQDSPPPIALDQVIGAFLMTKKAIVTPINADGDRILYQMGEPLGFNLLNDFSANDYMYFGNFTALRAEIILWRIQLLIEIIDGRRSSLGARVQVGVATQEQALFFDGLLSRIKIWVVVTSNEEKEAIIDSLAGSTYQIEVFSSADVEVGLAQIAFDATKFLTKFRRSFPRQNHENLRIQSLVHQPPRQLG